MKYLAIKIPLNSHSFWLGDDIICYLKHIEDKNINTGNGYDTEIEVTGNFKYLTILSKATQLSKDWINILKNDGLYIKSWVEEPKPKYFDIFGPFDAADRYFDAKELFDSLPDDYLILIPEK